MEKSKANDHIPSSESLEQSSGQNGEETTGKHPRDLGPQLQIADGLSKAKAEHVRLHAEPMTMPELVVTADGTEACSATFTTPELHVRPEPIGLQDETGADLASTDGSMSEFLSPEGTPTLKLHRAQASDSCLALTDDSTNDAYLTDGTRPYTSPEQTHPERKAKEEKRAPNLDELQLSFSGADESNASFCNKCMKPVTENHVCYGVGQILGKHYQILGLIGEGGMGSVYKAKHLIMRKIVAIKVLNPRLGLNAPAIRRFQREALATAKLDHPSIVRVNEFDADENGLPFMVMDYFEGDSLARLLHDQGPLPLESVIDVMGQVCDALLHAHRRGVVHRDLKPSNILLVDTDENASQVRILDFGIAKIVADAGSESAELKLTQTGHVLGSPVYMSPEQCTGKPLDARSDIYSLGCMMFEAVTGVPPFVGANIVETLYMQTHKMPPSISEVRPDLPYAQRIDAVILKCMAKDPEARYQNMAELKLDLEGLIAAPPRGWLEPLRDRWQMLKIRRHAEMAPERSRSNLVPVIIGIAAVMTISSVCGLLYFRSAAAISDKPWQELDIAGQKQLNIGDYRAAEKTFFEAFRKSVPEANTNPLLALALARNDVDAAVKAAAEHKEEPQIIVSMEELIDTYIASGEYAKAEKLSSALSVHRRESISEAAVQRLSTKLAQALKEGKRTTIENVLFDIRNEVFLRSVWSQNREMLARRTLEQLTKSLGPDDVFVARWFGNLGEVLVDRNDWNGARQCFEKAWRIYTTGMTSPTTATDGFRDLNEKVELTLIGLGKTNLYTGSYDVAVRWLDQALLLLTKEKLADATIAEVRVWRGQAYLGLGKFPEAIDDFHTALRAMEFAARSSKDTPLLGISKGHCLLLLAKAEIAQKDFTSATKHAQQALDVQETYLRKNPCWLALTLEQVGDLAPKGGELKPQFLYRRALAVLQRSQPDDHATISRILASLERAKTTPLSVLQKAYSWQMKHDEEASSSGTSKYLYDDYRALANLLRAGAPPDDAPDLEGASKMWERALVVAEKSRGAMSEEALEALTELGAVELDRGKRVEAEPHLRRALAIVRHWAVKKSDNLRHSANEINTLLTRMLWLLENSGRADDAAKLKQEFPEFLTAKS
ncbi:MAG TPA: serine/threonine-protein kinase [Candidatus Obscuribacterales bacterium]